LTYFTELFGAVGVVTPFLFYAIGFIAVLITAVSKSGFGGAVALGIPLLILVTSPRVALAVTLPILLIIDIWVVFFSSNKINYKLLTIMLIFGLLGHGFGWYFFDYISNAALVTFIGSMSVLTAFLYFKKRFLPVKIDLVAIPPLQSRPIALWSWGRFLVHTFRHCQLYFSFRRHPFADISIILQGAKDCFYRLSRVLFFFILNLTKVPLYWELDILSKSSLIISLLLLPAIPIGVILGRKISDLDD
jgi:uncharacterized membrane protein YfcA